MQKYLRLVGYGILTWLIPMFVSFFFYDKNGACQINVDLFKSLMLVVGTLAGCWLLVKYFQKISGDYLRQSVIVGISWLLI
ncbi:MAG: hypothetical protein LBL50_02505, partial [Candidatus Margulisbacteria bacterium]|nr:hypothetical protein [Candidatus Margulisiibacteriota bacterium]